MNQSNQSNHKNQINHCSDNCTYKYKWMREFNNAHYIANYGWIFTSDNPNGKVVKRNP
jgi:hypothetical protein